MIKGGHYKSCLFIWNLRSLVYILCLITISIEYEIMLYFFCFVLVPLWDACNHTFGFWLKTQSVSITCLGPLIKVWDRALFNDLLFHFIFSIHALFLLFTLYSWCSLFLKALDYNWNPVDQLSWAMHAHHFFMGLETMVVFVLSLAIVLILITLEECP